MRFAKLLSSATVLAAISLASVVVGLSAFKIIGNASRLAVQVPVAVILGVAGMVGWFHGLRRVHGLIPESDFVPSLLLGFPVSGLRVVGVHYLVTGYLTALGNIFGAWLVLFAEAPVAMPTASAIGRRRREESG